MFQTNMTSLQPSFTTLTDDQVILEARRQVWSRDEGRCAFRSGTRRCSETAWLEFHHVTPYADGGLATTENIELRCRAHNQYEASLLFAERDEVREAAGVW